MCKFRPLTADEVDVRIGQATEKGVQLLLYKDARVDMAVLDSTVGVLNWQREHYECKGNLYCRVGINRNHDKPELAPEWVWKSDCGSESNTEAEKGEASDSFKRACTNFGIGRELYTAPFIWVPAGQGCTIKTVNGKPKCYDRFKVTSMTVSDGKITALEIVNESMKSVAYRFGKTPAVKPDDKAEKRAWASTLP